MNRAMDVGNVTTAEKAAITADTPTGWLYLAGFIEYQDAFGLAHQTRFLFTWEKGRGMVLHQKPKYTYYD